MKTIEEIRKEAKCPTCKKGDKLTFSAENGHCERCDVDFDLGMKKFN
jgi:Zn ribbon nucleic-acid-binding protein